MRKCPESPVSFWWWWARGPLSCSGRYRGGSLAWESGDLVPVPDLSPPAQSRDVCPRCSELQPSATQAPRVPLWTAEPRPAAGAASRLQERKSEQGLGFSGQPTKPCWNLQGGARMDTALGFLLDFDGLLDSVFLWAGRAHPQCHRPPHRCRPCSPRLRHSASAAGCSDHSCTGTGPCHSGECSLSVGTGASVLIRPGYPCGPALTLLSRPSLRPVCLPTSSEPSAQS